MDYMVELVFKNSGIDVNWSIIKFNSVDYQKFIEESFIIQKSMRKIANEFELEEVLNTYKEEYGVFGEDNIKNFNNISLAITFPVLELKEQLEFVDIETVPMCQKLSEIQNINNLIILDWDRFLRTFPSLRMQLEVICHEALHIVEMELNIHYTHEDLKEECNLFVSEYIKKYPKINH